MNLLFAFQLSSVFCISSTQQQIAQKLGHSQLETCDNQVSTLGEGNVLVCEAK